MTLKYESYIRKPPQETLELLGSSPDGLTTKEIEERLALYGRNLVEEASPPWMSILIRQFHSYFIYLLFGAALINVSIKEFLDAALIGIFVVIYAATGFYQEFKAEHAIQSLKNYLTRYTRVKRNGDITTINIQELVPGDIVFLNEGDLIPADIRIIRNHNLLIDESVLTGESAPVPKSSHEESGTPENDLAATNIAFLGSIVVGGFGEGVVMATGIHTYFANIFEKIGQIERPSLFEKHIRSIGATLTNLILILASLILAVQFFVSGAISFSYLLFLVALIVAVVPEALPLIVALAFSKGALLLAKKKVIIRRLSAIQDLGSVDIICTDKTGTLTKNELQFSSSLGSSEPLLFKLALANALNGKKLGKLYNPFDKAIFEAAPRNVITKLASLNFLEAFPFDATKRIKTVLFEEAGVKYLVGEGAPEILLEHSHLIEGKNGGEPLTGEAKAHVLQWFRERGQKGERVLGVAYKKISSASPHIKEEESGFTFVGCLSFRDPLKETSSQAIELIQALGLTFKIITGDSREVATALGKKLHLITSENEVMTGEAFEKLTGKEREAAAESCVVFARTLPSHKQSIIETLERRHAVGFLGEGFNDVPALKAAHLSMVVDNSSDMARNVADVILLDKDLLVIAQGIAEGRKIFANVTKYIRTTLSANIGNFLSLIIASFLLPYLPLLSIQILLVNLLSDLPMIAISLDTVGVNEIHKPHAYDFKKLYLFVMVFGAVSSFFDLIFFFIFRTFGASSLQTGWFIFSILTEIVAFISLRTFLPILKAKAPSGQIVIASGIAIGATIVLTLMPFARSIFHFVLLSRTQWMLIAALLGAYFLANEEGKRFFKT